MLLTERIIASIGIVWVIISIIVQWAQSRGTGRTDYSARSGDVIRGIIYNFTWAMLPSHKETVRLHPYKFVIGTLMHIGIFLALAKALMLIVWPQVLHYNPAVPVVILAIAILCGIYLFFRRVLSSDLRKMSAPEDYISVVVTLGFMIAAMAHESGLISPGAFLICAAIVFFYMPIGKLKHAWFFFIARADYGARLGYRGTYPARNGAGE